MSSPHQQPAFFASFSQVRQGGSGVLLLVTAGVSKGPFSFAYDCCYVSICISVLTSFLSKMVIYKELRFECWWNSPHWWLLMGNLILSHTAGICGPLQDSVRSGPIRCSSFMLLFVPLCIWPHYTCRNSFHKLCAFSSDTRLFILFDSFLGSKWRYDPHLPLK